MSIHRLFTGQSHLNDLIQARDIARALQDQPDLQLDFTGIESVTPEFAAELCRAIVQVRGPDALRSALLLQTMALPCWQPSSLPCKPRPRPRQSARVSSAEDDSSADHAVRST